MNSSTLVQKLCNYCNVLRDDGRSYGDCVEQLTDLLFRKVADERSRPPRNQPSPIPVAYAWSALLAKDGDALFDHCRHTLEALGRQPGTLALIFGKAQNKFQDPAKLRRVIVDLIDAENWSAMGADVKGDACEGLLERNAQDIKSGAGAPRRFVWKVDRRLFIAREVGAEVDANLRRAQALRQGVLAQAFGGADIVPVGGRAGEGNHSAARRGTRKARHGT